VRKRIIGMIIVIVLIIVSAIQFWKVLLPNQLEYTIREYFKGISNHSINTYMIHDTAEWLDGELVVVEDNEMIGIVYLEKKYGIYKVKNHALCSKVDTIRDSFMKNVDYQYRLLRVQSFVYDRDILIAYVNDAEIKSMKLVNTLKQLSFDLPENKKLIFSEENQLFSIIRSQSEVYEESFIEWKGEKIEDQIKYNVNNITLKSLKPLNIAMVSEFAFKVDKNILIEKLRFEDLDDISAEKYDAVFIDSDMSNVKFDKIMLDNLVNSNWDVFVIDPLENSHLYGNANIDRNTIIIEKSRGGVGSWSKSDHYDLETNYLRAYNSIIELLSSKKE